MKKIVSFFGEKNAVFEKLNSRAEEHAQKRGLEYVWAPQTPFDQRNVIEELKNADAGIIDIEPYGEDIFKKINKSCKILTRFGVGYDKVDLKAASKYNIAVARTAGANTVGVAEMAIMLMLSAQRQLKKNMRFVSEGNWVKEVSHEITGSTVGIVGFGAIGQYVAKLLSGFDCNIIAYDPYPNLKAAEERNVKLVSLEELFKTADTITVHVPYMKETHNIINLELIKTMKPSAVIVNTSRGNIINEADLYEALAQNIIAGAGLDVFGVEPLPLDSPLLKLDNIILTPHTSSQTEESLWRIYEMAIDITADFFEGKESEHILNPDYKAQK